MMSLNEPLRARAQSALVRVLNECLRAALVRARVPRRDCVRHSSFRGRRRDVRRRT